MAIRKMLTQEEKDSIICRCLKTKEGQEKLAQTISASRKPSETLKDVKSFCDRLVKDQKISRQVFRNIQKSVDKIRSHA